MSWPETMVRALASRVLLALLLMSPAMAARAAELLMFEKPGCVWCDRWKQEVGIGYSRSEEGRRAPVRIVHLDSSTARLPGLNTRVTVTPTFVLMNQGREVGRIVGYPGADFFWGLLGQLMERLPSSAWIAPSLEFNPRQIFVVSHPHRAERS